MGDEFKRAVDLELAQDLQRAKDFERQAEEKRADLDFSGAARLYDKAGGWFKHADAWNEAGAAFVKMAECLLKLDRKVECAARAYAHAARCYKKTTPDESRSLLKMAVKMYIQMGKLIVAAKHFMEIPEIFELEKKLDQAIEYYEKAADFFQFVEFIDKANQCKLKVAHLAIELEQYQKATEIYEDFAQQTLDSSLLDEAKGHLLNAGICQLCKGDVVAFTAALERYQDLDPSFSGTREYRFLADISSAIAEGDVAKFTDAVKELDSMTPRNARKTTLFLRMRVKEKLKLKSKDLIT